MQSKAKTLLRDVESYLMKACDSLERQLPVLLSEAGEKKEILCENSEVANL